MEELDSSNCSSFELMPTESGSVYKEGRYTLPVIDLVLDGRGSSDFVPAVFSYLPCEGKKNKGEPWDSNAYLYAAIIPSNVLCHEVYCSLV